jgi:hypothetical protein
VSGLLRRSNPHTHMYWRRLTIATLPHVRWRIKPMLIGPLKFWNMTKRAVNCYFISAYARLHPTMDTSTGTSEGKTYIYPPAMTEKIECLRTDDLGVLFTLGFPRGYEVL